LLREAQIGPTLTALECDLLIQSDDPLNIVEGCPPRARLWSV